MDERKKVATTAGGAIGLSAFAPFVGLCCVGPWAVTILGVSGAVAVPYPGEAQELVNDVGSGAPLDGRFSVGISTGRLFGLLVAGSFSKGVKPFESRETLISLATQTQTLLAEAAIQQSKGQ